MNLSIQTPWFCINWNWLTISPSVKCPNTVRHGFIVQLVRHTGYKCVGCADTSVPTAPMVNIFRQLGSNLQLSQFANQIFKEIILSNENQMLSIQLVQCSYFQRRPTGRQHCVVACFTPLWVTCNRSLTVIQLFEHWKPSPLFTRLWQIVPGSHCTNRKTTGQFCLLIDTGCAGVQSRSTETQMSPDHGYSISGS